MEHRTVQKEESSAMTLMFKWWARSGVEQGVTVMTQDSLLQSQRVVHDLRILTRHKIRAEVIYKRLWEKHGN